MSDNRLGGKALIIGSVAMLVTMAFHPWGRQFTDENFFAMSLLNSSVHTLGIASMAISFLGGIALYRRLDDPGRVALVALVSFGIATVAGLCAATISGFVAPRMLHQMWHADPADKKYWDSIEHLGWWLNQAFARVLVMASAIAILLWSAVMLRTRALSTGFATYGVIFAPIAFLAVWSGHIQLDVHGFGAIALLQAIWFIGVGMRLTRVDLSRRSV